MTKLGAVHQLKLVAKTKRVRRTARARMTKLGTICRVNQHLLSGHDTQTIAIHTDRGGRDHPPSSSAWAAFALSAPWVARALLGAVAGPSQGRTLYCPVTAVHLPTRRIYPLSVGSIRWIYPLDLSVGRQLPTGAASCHWHILSQQPAQLALRWSRLSTPRGGPRRRVPGSPEPALPLPPPPVFVKVAFISVSLDPG